MSVPHGRHPVQGVDEGRDLADALLEEVAETVGPGCQQLTGVAILDVRQHEHGEAGATGAGLGRGLEPRS